MIVVENHRAAARSNLRKAIGKSCRNEADVNRKSRVDMFMERLRYFGQVATSCDELWILLQSAQPPAGFAGSPPSKGGDFVV
jgi:hypothetical protein